MGCSDSLQGTDERLGCICPRWTADDEMDHKRGTERVERKQGLHAVREVLRVSSVVLLKEVCTYYVVVVEFGLSPGFHWPQNLFYNTQFCRDNLVGDGWLRGSR